MLFLKLRFKKAKKGDAKKLRRLFSSMDPQISQSSIERMIANEKVLVIKHKGKIKAAFVYVIFGITGIFALMYIRKIVVDQNLRGQGVGSFLLQKIKHFSHKKRVDFSFLYSLKQAVGFYHKNKLRNIGRFFWWNSR